MAYRFRLFTIRNGTIRPICHTLRNSKVKATLFPCLFFFLSIFVDDTWNLNFIEWDREQTIDSLIKKSGFDGDIDAALKAKIKIERYQTKEVEAHYDEWQQWRSSAKHKQIVK